MMDKHQALSGDCLSFRTGKNQVAMTGAQVAVVAVKMHTIHCRKKQGYQVKVLI